MIKKILLGFLVFLFVVIGLGGTIFHFYRAHEPLYVPTGLNDHFPDLKPGTKFDEYTKITQDMIRKARVQSGTANPDVQKEDQIIEARSPFETRPLKLAPDQQGKTHKYRNGVLIVHGLNRTPREMHSVADYFAKLGFLVRVTILPGHGTIIGDLGRVQAEDWLKMHTFGMESFKGEVDHLYLMGFSTGGLLTCVQALDHKKMEENNVRGLILMSPALEIKLKSAAVLPYLFSTMDKIPMLSFPVRVKEDDAYGYQSVSLNAGYQIYRLIQKLKEGRKTSEINLPVYTATTMEDLIVDVPAVKDYLYSLPNENNEHVIYTVDPIVLPKVKGHAEQINSSQGAWGGRVIGFSHSAMHVAPEDHYYGRFTDFRPCGHYDEKDSLYQKCLSGNKLLSDKNRSCGVYFSDTAKLKTCKDTKAFVGETSDENLKKYKPLQALMYNNKFKYMFRIIDRFLFKTGAIDTRRYQMRELERANVFLRKINLIPAVLKEKYNNSDLSSTFEDVSVDLDLTSLETLDLKDTNITDFSALSQLLELNHLSINGNGDFMNEKVSYDMSSLKDLKKLSSLSLIKIHVTDLSFLKELKNLNHIILESTGISKIQIDDLRKAVPQVKIDYVNDETVDDGADGMLQANFQGDLDKYYAHMMEKYPEAMKAVSTLFLDHMKLTSGKGIERLTCITDMRFNTTNVPDIKFFEPLKSLDLKEIKFLNMDPGEGEKFQILAPQLEKMFPNVKITVDFSNLLKDRLMNNLGNLADALKDIEKPYNLPKYMRNLVVNETPLSDISILSNYEGLENLNIVKTSITDLTPLAKLKNLQSIRAAGSKIENLKGLENKSQLWVVDIDDTAINDLTPLEGASKIEMLSAKNTKIKSLALVSGMPLINYLDVSGTQIKDLKGIEGAIKLKTLRAANTEVSDMAPLKNLVLTNGEFTHTKVDDISALIDSKNVGLGFAYTPFGDASKFMRYEDEDRIKHVDEKGKPMDEARPETDPIQEPIVKQ